MIIIYTHTWRQSSLQSRQISWLWEPTATARQRRATFTSVHLRLEHWAPLATAGHHHTLDSFFYIQSTILVASVRRRSSASPIYIFTHLLSKRIVT